MNDDGFTPLAFAPPQFMEKCNLQNSIVKADLNRINIYRPNFDNDNFFKRIPNNFEGYDKINEDFYPLDTTKVPKKLLEFYSHS